MCGRFALRTSTARLAARFGIAARDPRPPAAGDRRDRDRASEDVAAADDLPDAPPSHNVAPTHLVTVVLADPSGRRRLERMRWGLVPAWAADPSIGSRLINARAETLAEKPSFRNAFRRRRCLIVADGFFEWREVEGRRQPFYVRLRSAEPFAMAGLYEEWRPTAGVAAHPAARPAPRRTARRPDAAEPPDLFGAPAPDGAPPPEPPPAAPPAHPAAAPAGPLRTCVIVTVAANALMARFHDRMPAILPEADWDAWLDPRPADPARLLPLLRPFPPEEMVYHDVATLVNSPRHNAPELLEPIGPIEALEGPLPPGA